MISFLACELYLVFCRYTNQIWRHTMSRPYRIRNKEVSKRNSHTHYLNHKEEYLARARKAYLKRIELIRELKNGVKCSRCPESHPACIDWHHIDPNEKEIAVSQAIRLGWSIERIKAEIAKCVPLCANCHRKEHWQEWS